MGRTAGSGLTGAAGSSDLSSLGGFASNLLSPDQELAILLESILTADALIDELGMEFDNPMQLLLFILMIHEQKLAEVLSAMWSGSATLPTPPMP
jgi:hypothetical protein